MSDVATLRIKSEKTASGADEPPVFERFLMFLRGAVVPFSGNLYIKVGSSIDKVCQIKFMS